MRISEFQELISKKYEKRDRERGVPATFMWFIEEVGELATALAAEDKKNIIVRFEKIASSNLRAFGRSHMYRLSMLYFLMYLLGISFLCTQFPQSSSCLMCSTAQYIN